MVVLDNPSRKGEMHMINVMLSGGNIPDVKVASFDKPSEARQFCDDLNNLMSRAGVPDRQHLGTKSGLNIRFAWTFPSKE